MKKKYSVITKVILFISLISFNIGYGTWMFTMSNIYDNSQVTKGNVEGDSVVCYIDTDTKANQYTSIEVALAKAKSMSGSQTVYVKPNLGFTVTIKRDCEIGSGDTLCLPYIGIEKNNIQFHEYVGGSTHGLAYETGTRDTYVEIAEGTALLNNGTLTIGAVQNSGNGGTSPNGNATEKYAELKLLANSRLINNGTINCYGYVSGIVGDNTAKIISNSSSIVNMPFSIIEHRGGSRFAGMAGKDKNEVQHIVNSSVSSDGEKTGEGKPVTYVFNRWFMDGFININFEFKSGSKLVGKAALYADNEHNTADMDIISSTGLVKLSDSSSLCGSFDTNTKKYQISTFGSWRLGHLNVYFAIKKKKVITVWIKINISSSGVLLPIPHYFNIELNPFADGSSAEVNTTLQSFKLLPGSSLVVNKNVTLDAKEIAIYKNESFYPNGESIEVVKIDKDNNIYPVGNKQYPKENDAILSNYGKINATAIGGVITVHSGSSIKTTIANKVVSNEVVSFSSESIDVKVKIGIIPMKIPVNIYLQNCLPIELEKSEKVGS